jgi:biopolymer transport protein ExbB
VRRSLALAAVIGCGFDSSGLGGSATDVASDPTTSGTSPTSTTSMPTATTDPSDPSDPSTDPSTDPTMGESSTTPADTTEDPSQGTSSSESGDVADWWNPDWAKRRRLTLTLPPDIDTQDDVPVLVLLDSTRITYAELQSRGQDLRFVDEDDETLLAHEIEHWDPDGTSAVWVRVPKFAPSDTIYMYWGNGDAPGGSDPHGVWMSGYAATYHLDNDPEGEPPQILDSSPSDRHAIAQGGMTIDDVVPGVATPALTFDGTDDVVEIGAIDTDGWTEITVSAWVRHTTNEDDRVVSKAFGTGGMDHVFFLGAHGEDVKVRVRTDGEMGGSLEVRPGDTLPVDAWTYIAMVWSAASAEVVVYADGVEVGSGALDGDTLADGAHEVLVGNAVDGQDRYFDGPIDEVRIEHTARGPEWFAVQFAGMNDGLVAFEAEESVP